MLTRLLFLALAASLLLGHASAEAGSRVALLIGNADYPAAPLRNPTNDVDAMEAALVEAGFDLVLARKNLDLRGMDAAVEEFREKARGSEIAVVFYSGHGIEVEGVNYLLPKDAVLDNDRTVKREALALDDVLDAMQGATKLRLVLLDACRDNPFVGRMKRTRSAANRGLVRVDPQISDTLIAYATAAGRTATDGEGRLSPFTAALVKHIVTPGLDVELALRRVRDDVREATRAAAARENRDPQEPYKTGSIGSTLVTLAVRPAEGASAPVISPPLDPNAVAAADFDRAKAIGSVAAWDLFLMRHPSGYYADLARQAREKLAAPASPPSTPPPSGASAPTQVAGTFPSARPSRPVSCADRPGLASATVRAARALTADEAACLQPKDVFKECDLCPELVVLPSGSFTMGSPSNEPERESDEGPQRTVTIGRAFAVGRYPVTVDQYRAFVEATGHTGGSRCWTFENSKYEERSGRSWRSPGYRQSGDHPVVCVAWNDAKAYVSWLSRTTGERYRLVSEAEWEYAARGRTEPGRYPRYFYGDDASAMCRYGNGVDQTAKSSIKGTSTWPPLGCDDGFAYTSPVGRFAANGFGLHDVHGNVWQWVEDCFADNYRGAPTDGSARTTGGCNSHPLRGGSWNNGPKNVRAAVRDRGTSDVRRDAAGFRVARTLGP